MLKFNKNTSPPIMPRERTGAEKKVEKERVAVQTGAKWGNWRRKWPKRKNVGL